VSTNVFVGSVASAAGRTIRLLAVLLAVASAHAQEGPDFSGTWEISQARSTPGALGNQAKVAFASELIVQQRGGELHVEMRTPRQDTISAVYRLDGSEITVKTPPGIVETARARLEGSTLVITARRVVSSAFGDFVTDTKESWTRSGTVLTVLKTASADNVVATETGVYHKV
jgi:hypothetical protein